MSLRWDFPMTPMPTTPNLTVLLIVAPFLRREDNKSRINVAEGGIYRERKTG
jgi:hypothetical protein